MIREAREKALQPQQAHCVREVNKSTRNMTIFISSGAKH